MGGLKVDERTMDERTTEKLALQPRLIVNLAGHNPLVRESLQRWMDGELPWDQALMRMVLLLAHHNERLREQVPGPYLARNLPDGFDHTLQWLRSLRDE